VIQGFRGTEYATQANERGEHGSFSPIDVHNTLVADGPSFQQQFIDPLPSGNVDVTPTIARLLGLSLPKAQGRVLHEALAGSLGRPLGDYHLSPSVLRPKQAATGLQMQRVDGSPLPTTRFDFTVQLKRLDSDGKHWTYFDQAGPQRN
jgi:hypothetical protein